VTNDDYDFFGNVLAKTDVNAVETQFLYDGRDRVTEVRILGAMPADDIVTEYEYDAVGNLSRIRRPVCVDVGAGCPFSLEYGWDEVNRLERIEDAAGNKVLNFYDLTSRLTRVEHRDGIGTLNLFANVAYDTNNRVLYVHFNDIVPEDPGSVFWKFSYDDNGNRLTWQDPEGHVTTLTYDELNRPETVTETVDATPLTTTFAYNRLDSLTARTSPEGFLSMYEWSDMGWLLSETSPDRGTTQNDFDPWETSSRQRTRKA
jgi:YD repeat-containing protein